MNLRPPGYERELGQFSTSIYANLHQHNAVCYSPHSSLMQPVTICVISDEGKYEGKQKFSTYIQKERVQFLRCTLLAFVLKCG